MSKFSEKVIQVVNSVPHGTVVSYGQVALYIGVPRAARQVGWILNRNEGKDLAWWRVINNQGRISIKGCKYNTPELQRKLLQAEGIHVDKEFNLDIEHYRFRPDHSYLKQFELDEEYLEMVLERIPPGE